ncbi:thyroglobulin-like, partial [Limulus polyphemus]|uniref:Thyroglobulin-like n=1 Tax=Limulus polyphemus TaxID=6850 RepID=A0ABM1TJ43_LIMPO
CSRAVSSFGKPLDPTELPRCKSNGNYESIQKTRDYLFCVDENGKLEKSPIFRNRTLSTLPCYDDKIHKNYKTPPPCYEERKTLINKIKIRESKGFTVVGLDLPRCDPDGTYAPIQFNGSKSYCVDKGGKIIKNTTVPRYSEEARKMNCNCVRMKLLLKNNSKMSGLQTIFSKYRCDKNGNYLPMQCMSLACYCVDTKMGFQKGTAVLTVNKNDLPCWKPEYDT